MSRRLTSWQAARKQRKSCTVGISSWARVFSPIVAYLKFVTNIFLRREDAERSRFHGRFIAGDSFWRQRRSDGGRSRLAAATDARDRAGGAGIRWHSGSPLQFRLSRYLDAACHAGRVHRTEIGKRRVGKECRSRWSPYH